MNAWIRTPGHFDAVIDFGRAAREPSAPGRLQPALQAGDWLHLNPQGCRVLVSAVPGRLFRNRG